MGDAMGNDWTSWIDWSSTQEAEKSGWMTVIFSNLAADSNHTFMYDVEYSSQ